MDHYDEEVLQSPNKGDDSDYEMEDELDLKVDNDDLKGIPTDLPKRSLKK